MKNQTTGSRQGRIDIEWLREQVQKWCYSWVNWPKTILVVLAIIGCMAIGHGVAATWFAGSRVLQYVFTVVPLVVFLIVLRIVDYRLWDWAYDPNRPWEDCPPEIREAMARLKAQEEDAPEGEEYHQESLW